MNILRITSLWTPFEFWAVRVDPTHYHELAGPKSGYYVLSGGPDRTKVIESAVGVYHVIQGST